MTDRPDFLQMLRATNGARAAAWVGDSPSDPLFWAVELGGETGEILNEVKKLRREELGWRGSRTTIEKLADEIADGLICLDSLARHYGIDLAEATARKFNATSEKVGLPHKLAAQVGTHPQGGDAKQAPGDSLSDAVGSEADDAPNPSSGDPHNG